MAGNGPPQKKGVGKNKVKSKTNKSTSDKPNKKVEKFPMFSITAPHVWR